MAECAEETASVPGDGDFLRIRDKIDGILPDHFPAEPFAALGVDEIHRAGVHFRPAGTNGKDHAVRQENAGVFDSVIRFCSGCKEAQQVHTVFFPPQTYRRRGSGPDPLTF